MPNFPLDPLDPSFDIEIAYNTALTTIAQLNQKLHQKNGELDLMKKELRKCCESLQGVLMQFINAEAGFKIDREQLLITINVQEKTIRELNQANHAFSERAIKLEFELIAAEAKLQIKKDGL